MSLTVDDGLVIPDSIGKRFLIASVRIATFSHAACEIYRTGKGLISLVTSRGVGTVAGTGRVTPSHANKRSVRQLGC